MPHDVFISYSSKDKLTSDAVCATLEARGIRCWIAPRDVTPGNDWTDEIMDALTSARVLVLLLSAASNDSQQVKREVQNAVSEGLPIVPFRLEDVSLSKHMRYFIGTPHWLDALTPPMEAHLERLAHTIQALLQATGRHEALEMIEVSEETEDAELEVTQAATQWNPDDLRQVERELAVVIGPMARVLVHQTALKVKNLSELCREVSQFVLQDAERQRFLEATQHIAPQGTPVTAPEIAAPIEIAQPVWDDNVLHTIERQLAEHMGPLARVLVKRASKQAANLDELYQSLSENLTSPKEKQAFLKGRQLLK